ncbi:DUF2905 domain-containing protein [Legionella qingyii]|uniref:DUF2905 domain-containing protein n=1 Tax=Legionella qingyii TaxID=2184757 RepID=UPI002D78CBF4|nr:DUF2905 domain-containing protein [Legionella qingyii]
MYHSHYFANNWYFFWATYKKIGLCKLPGDIIIKKCNFTFYFPITACILISLIITLIFWFFNK